MSPLFFILPLLILMIFPIVSAEPSDFVWAGGEKGVRLVPVYYVDQVFCNDYHADNKGCYNPNLDEITIKKGYETKWVPRGCSVLLHEQGHAFGLNEAQLSILNCPNPNIDESHGQYDPSNRFHSDPLYIWEGYAVEQDPRKFRVE